MSKTNILYLLKLTNENLAIKREIYKQYKSYQNFKVIRLVKKCQQQIKFCKNLHKLKIVWVWL